MKTIAGLILIAALTTSCAASRAYRRGQHAERAERYADAIRNYSEAAARSPENPTYRISLSSALIKSGEAHVKRGEVLERAGEIQLAFKEYCAAVAENPANDAAVLKRDVLHRRLLAAAESPSAAKAPPIPSPLASLPKNLVTLRMTDAELSEVFLAISRTTEVDFIFDETFKSHKVNVDFQKISFREMLDRLCLQNRLLFKPVDSRTILIYPDNEARRARYDEQLLKTFYLRNADVTKVAANIKTLVDLKRVMVDPDLRTITILDSAEKLELARRLIEKEDIRRAEIVIDVEILEFNRNRLRAYGLDFSSYAAGAAVAIEPATSFPTSSLIRGHMLGNLELSDIVFSIPSVVYRLLRTDTRTHLIARPQLRAAEGEKVMIKVGDRVPVPVTTFVPVLGAGGVPNQPITSFTMEPIGLSIEITPEVHYNEEITLKGHFELTSIVREGTVNLPPTIGNRVVETTIRLKDGESTIIAGLIKDEERRSRSGLPGISSLPVLGHLFASNQDSGNQTDLVLTVTPHIVRMAEFSEDERRALWVGTERQMRISDEPPPFAAAASEGEPAAEPAPRSQSGAPAPEPQTEPATPRSRRHAGNIEAGTVSFSFDPMENRVPEGIQFWVKLTARAPDPFVSCSVDVTFDGALIDLISVHPGEKLRPGLESKVSPGRVTITFRPGRHFDGEVCRIIFAASAPGSTKLQIEDAHATDDLGIDLTPFSTPATVQIEGKETPLSANTQ